MARIIRPKTGTSINRRGTAFDLTARIAGIFSSREGTIMYPWALTKPVLEESNYCAWLGLPKRLDLFNGLPINYKQPYPVCQGAIIQDLLRVDYQGNPIYELVDVGAVAV